MYRELLVTPDTIELMQDVQDGILGPLEERGPEQAVQKEDGTWSGGVAKERSNIARGVKGEHCHNEAMSIQWSKNLMSPVAATKVTGEEFEEHHTIRKKTLIVR
jgi:hypothetical protein